MLYLPATCLAAALCADGSPVLLVSDAREVSRSTTGALITTLEPLVQLGVAPLAIELSSSSRTLWCVFEESPGGPLIAGRVDQATGEVSARTGPLPCAAVSDIAAPLEGQRWFLAEPHGPDTRLWHGDLPHGDLALFTTLAGRSGVTGISLDVDGRLLAYDAANQVVVAIDTASGAETLVGVTHLVGAAPRGLDLDPRTGWLFGVFAAPGVRARLGSVDPATGRAELVAAWLDEAAPLLVVERSTADIGASFVPWTSAATTHVRGSGRIEANDLRLEAVGLPTHSFGLFLASSTHAPPAATVPGALCLVPPFQRLAAAPGQLLPTGPDGCMRRTLDVAALREGGALDPAATGALVHFQAWVRAGLAGPTFARPVRATLTEHDPGPIDRYPAALAVNTGSIAHGDVDGDGDIDVVYAPGRLGRNDGQGGFTWSSTPSIGPYLASFELIDIDGDTDLDLAWTSTLGGLCVARNDGTGAFAPSECWFTCRAMPGLGRADIDGDGRLDLCYACEEPNLLVVHYGAASGFAPPRGYDTLSAPASPALHDVDQDGLLDFVVPLRNEGSLRVLRNLGNRVFDPLPPVPTGAGPAQGALLDLLPAPGPEIVTWSTTQRTLTIHAGGAGTALPVLAAASIPELSSRPLFVDLDRDGNLDLSVRGGFGLVTLRSDGHGNFTPAWNLDTTVGSPQSTALADFDGDGWLDALCLGGDVDALVIVRGTPAVWPAPRTRVSIDLGSVLHAVADFDGDGVDDIVTARTSGLSVLRGMGALQFAPPVVTPTLGSHGLTVVGDLAGDSDLDLAALGPNGLRVHENVGGLRFGPARDFPTPYANATLALGDIDRDGDLDAIVVGTNTVSIRRNDGTGAFPTLENHFVSAGLSAVAIADLDADGWPDVLVASGVHRYMHVFYNDGHGSLLPAVSPVSPQATARVASHHIPLADLDDDGLLDIAATNVYLNQGGRRLFREVTTTPGWLFHEERVNLADLDGDGWIDALSIHAYEGDSTVTLRRGSGTGRFGPEELYIGAGRRGEALVRDLDRDGRPEVLLGTHSHVLVLGR